MPPQWWDSRLTYLIKDPAFRNKTFTSQRVDVKSVARVGNQELQEGKEREWIMEQEAPLHDFSELCSLDQPW